MKIKDYLSAALSDLLLRILDVLFSQILSIIARPLTVDCGASTCPKLVSQILSRLSVSAPQIFQGEYFFHKMPVMA